MSNFTASLPPNRRTLEQITFPDGVIRPVKYMRDGLIIFADGGPGATYERTTEGEVVITPIVSREEAVTEVLAYKERVRFGRK